MRRCSICRVTQMDLLADGELQWCLPKGEASYWAVSAGVRNQDAVWSYEDPLRRLPHQGLCGLLSEQGGDEAEPIPERRPAKREGQ